MLTQGKDDKPKIHKISQKDGVLLLCRYPLKSLDAIMVGTATKDGRDGADYWLYYENALPDYYVTDDEAKALGWKRRKGNLADVLPYMMLGGMVYRNKDEKLPDAPGRIWYVADINYEGGYRNSHRVLYSNDGLVFVTYDHYHSFYEITGGAKW